MIERMALTRRLERSATNEEAINVGLLAQLSTVLVADTASVQDSGLLSDLGADALEPVTDGLVNLLRLLGGSDLASTNGPDGLIGNDNLAPVGELRLEGLKLLGDDLDGIASLTHLQTLAAAPDDAEAILSGVLGLGRDNIIRLVEECTALRVAKDGPGNVAVRELRHGDLAGEGTVGLVEDVLGSNLDLGSEKLTSEEEVEGRRSDDNL